LADNMATVEPGNFYRSGQIPGGRLSAVVRRHGIRTVINLRGAAPQEDWYRAELSACESLGVAHEDFDWFKDHLPEPESLAAFVRLINEAERPILVHCQGGVHRSAVASACYLLMNGASVDEARDEFGLFFNDAPIGGLLDLYEGSALPFAQWVATVYPERYAATDP
jgi:protein tyrosine/serine phosphatase